MADISKIDREIAWGDAVTEYEAGNPGPLADLLRSPEPMPAAIAAELAGVIERRTKRPRNADKRKLTVSKHRELAYRWKNIQRYLDVMRSAAQDNEARMEPAEVLGWVRDARESILKELAEEYGVSVETVRKARAPNYRQTKRG